MNNLYLIKSGDNGFVEETSAVISAEGGDISINGGLHVDSAGNIGMGTSDPTNKLDVVGSASISSDLTVDNIILSNVGGQSPVAVNDVIAYNGSAWVPTAASTLPGGGGGGAGNSDVPAGLINTLTQGESIHEVNFGFDSNNDRIVYDNVPKIAASLEIDGPGEIIPHTVSGVSQSGYFVVFSEELPTANYRMHTVFGGTDAFWETGVVNLEYSERNVEIDRSLYVGQRVGIGTTSPADELHINSTSSNVNLRLTRDTDTGGRISCSDGADTPAIIFETIDSGNLLEKMRIDSDGNVGIGTTNPNAKLVIQEDSVVNTLTEAVSFLGGNYTSASNAESFKFFHQTNTANTNRGVAFKSINGSLQIQTIVTSSNADAANNISLQPGGGNVGIGTTSPIYPLDVFGFGKSIAITSQHADGTRITHASLSNDSSGDGLIALNNDVGNSKVRILSNGKSYFNGGNVGIGTTSPLDELHVFNDITAPRIKIQCANSSNAALLFGDVDDDTEAGILWDANTQKLHIRGYNNTNRITIDDAGDVGIGTTSTVFSAGSGLRIERDATATLRLQDTGANGFEIRASSVAAEFYNANSKPFTFETGGSEVMRITSAGNVGIGTTSPNSLLELSSGGDTVLNITAANNKSSAIHFSDPDAENQGIITYTHTSDSLRFFTQNTEQMRIDSSGNVGIGTTNPTAHLDVRGSGELSLRLYRETTTATDDVFQVRTNVGGTNILKFRVEADGDVISATNSYTSDERAKTEISDLSYGLDEIKQLQPKQFKMRHSEEKGFKYGFIAQEAETILPDLIRNDGIEDGEGGSYKALEYNSIIAILTKAIQEQQTIIEDLKSRIENLEQ